MNKNSVIELQETKPIVNEDLQTLLEAILDDVKQAKVISGAMVVVYSDASSGSVFAGENILCLLAELLIVQREIIDCHVNLRMHNAGEPY